MEYREATKPTIETMRTMKALNASANSEFCHVIIISCLYTSTTRAMPRRSVATEPVRITDSACFRVFVKKHDAAVRMGARRRYSIIASPYQCFEHICIYALKCPVYPEYQYA